MNFLRKVATRTKVGRKTNEDKAASNNLNRQNLKPNITELT